SSETGAGIGSTTLVGGSTGIKDLFGGTGSTGVVTPHSAAPTSALNLYGQVVDQWGIKAATPVSNITLKIPKMTGAQLQQLLKNLPDGVTYGIELEKESNYSHSAPPLEGLQAGGVDVK